MPFTAVELQYVAVSALNYWLNSDAFAFRQEFRDQYAGTIRGGFGSEAEKHAPEPVFHDEDDGYAYD